MYEIKNLFFKFIKGIQNNKKIYKNIFCNDIELNKKKFQKTLQ